jgi:hypothetical protein
VKVEGLSQLWSSDKAIIAAATSSRVQIPSLRIIASPQPGVIAPGFADVVALRFSATRRASGRRIATFRTTDRKGSENRAALKDGMTPQKALDQFGHV